MEMVIVWHHDFEAIFIDDDKNYEVDCYVLGNFSLRQEVIFHF